MIQYTLPPSRQGLGPRRHQALQGKDSGAGVHLKGAGGGGISGGASGGPIPAPEPWHHTGMPTTLTSPCPRLANSHFPFRSPCRAGLLTGTHTHTHVHTATPPHAGTHIHAGTHTHTHTHAHTSQLIEGSSTVTTGDFKVKRKMTDRQADRPADSDRQADAEINNKVQVEGGSS